MLDLFEIVQDRPLEEKPEDKAKCPYCNSEELTPRGSSTTLLGWFGDVNPNHRWEHFKCKSCERPFIREIKELNVWYTDAGRLLKGMPSCFETYIYHCAKCEGEVHRHYTGLDGISEPKTLGWQKIDGKIVKDYRIFYKCSSCGHGGEVADDYWSNR